MAMLFKVQQHNAAMEKLTDEIIPTLIIGKNITANDMGYWLSQRGVQIRDCQLLTTSNEARTFAYKITVDAKDHDRVTQDASLWPYGVGVRLYKIFENKRQEMRSGANKEMPPQTNRDAQGARYGRYGQH